jgi:hypothetical protein
MRQPEQNTTTRRGLLGAVGAAAAASLTGCIGSLDPERTTTDVEHTVSAEAVDQLSLSADDAETTVQTWDEQTVQISATKYAIGQTDLSEVRVTRDVAGGELSVGVELTDNFQLGTVGGGVEDMDVRVPSDVTLTRLDTDDGTVSTTDVGGSVDVDIDDGEVTVDGVDELGGSLGDGSLEAVTPVVLDNLRGDDAEIDVRIGDLDGDTTVECDDGRIVARVDPGLDATLIVESDDAKTKFEDSVVDTFETVGDGRLRGEIGDGGDQLRLAVDDGVVDVRSA